MKQKGVVDIVLVMIAVGTLAGLATGGYLVYKFQHAAVLEAQQEKDAYKRSAEIYEGVANEMSEEKKLADRISGDRAKLVARLQEENAFFRARVSELASKDKDVATLIVLPIPDSLRRLRRQSAGCSDNLQLPCPGGTAATDTGSGNGGPPSR